MRNAWDEARGAKPAANANKPWIGLTRDGKPYQKPRCWTGVHGCGEFFDASEFDFEHRMCRQCVHGFEINWGVPQTMVGILLACLHLDHCATVRIRYKNKDKDFNDGWAQTHEDRIRWLLTKLGNKPWEADQEKTKKLSADYFHAALDKAEIVQTRGRGIQPVE